MHNTNLQQLKLELSIKAKNGVNFILAASVVWLAIAWIWSLNYSNANKSIFTFMVGGAMLPLAFVFGKILKTAWKIKGNPLEPLGLWLNFAQLLYFPFLILVLLKMPEYFLMTYIIITGAHFFPYAWFYNEKAYAIFAVLISAGALIIGLNLPASMAYLTGVFMSVMLLLLSAWIYLSYMRKKERQAAVAA